MQHRSTIYYIEKIIINGASGSLAIILLYTILGLFVSALSQTEKETAMIDYILAGLSAGLFAFLIFFAVSFVTLGLTTAVVHLIGAAYRFLFAPRTTQYREQTA